MNEWDKQKEKMENQTDKILGKRDQFIVRNELEMSSVISVIRVFPI
jgi:hypothetical protein